MAGLVDWHGSNETLYLLAPGQASPAGWCWVLTRDGALQAAFVGAMAIADMVKTTLGPKGMVRAQA